MNNVLVIDDSCDVRSVITNTLAQFGFSTREATNGSEGIRLALEETPDLIICDMRMPGMDGYETLSAVRDNPALASLPFIFLTACIDKKDFRRGMRCGADDYLTKPFTTDELLDAVTTRLARQTELQSGLIRRAEKLHEGVVQLFAQELTGPIEGILDVTSTMIREYAVLSPDRVLLNARQINDSIARLNHFTHSLAQA